MTTLLLIDDDERLAELLGEYLARFDLHLLAAARPGDGLALLGRQPIDLVILDVMLPDMDGFEVCRAIRRHSEVPIVMLTARGEVMDRVVGLELGADDYLPKPFEPRELVARIQRILRRARPAPARLRFEGLEIDPAARRVAVAGAPVELTAMELELLLLLAREPERVFSRDDILARLKGIETEVFSRAVDILVSRVRQKLRPLQCIETVRGTGYRFAGRPL